jgi:two-component system invasion response regulator UvrY
MRVLLIDKQEIILKGIQSVLKKEVPALKCSGYTELEKADLFLATESCDLVIMENNWEHTNVHAFIEQWLARHPSLRILVFSFSPPQIYAKWMLQTGVKGFISKYCPVSELLVGIQTILRGDLYLSQHVFQEWVHDLFSKKTRNPFVKLSNREMEVCHHLIQGLFISEIAQIMQLHPSTIGTHQHRIFKKLGVSRVIELQQLAQQVVLTQSN